MPPKKSVRSLLNKLTIGQKVTFVVAVIGGCCVVVAALIGLGIPIVGFILERSAAQNALATPTFLPPTDAVELPGSQTDILSVAINSYANNNFQGIITRDLDPSKTPKITIKKSDVIFVGDASPKISFVGKDSLLIFEIYLTGKAVDEEVQVTNRIPIKVSYDSLPDKANVYRNGEPGGGSFYSIFFADISQKSQQVWAKYSSDFRETYQQNQPICQCFDISQYPSEIQKYLTSNEQNAPDYFLLQKNEKIGIPVVLFFQDPGTYHLQIGIEYIYHQYKDIIWTEPNIQVVVPENYYTWMCDNADWTSSTSSCKIENACVTKSDGTTNCNSFINP